MAKLLIDLVGLPRFELGTSCTPSKRDTRLRYSPILSGRHPGHHCRTAIGVAAIADWALLKLITELKPEAHRCLQRSRAAGLQDGGQSAAGAAGTQHEVQHRGGLTEYRTAQELHRVGEIGLVQRVEGFQAHLDDLAVLETKLAAQGEIHLSHAEARDGA